MPILMAKDRARRGQSGYSLIEMLMVVGIIAIVSAIAVPYTNNTFATFRLSGDARAIVNRVSVAKMRAAAKFSQARLYVDLAARNYRVEVLDRSGTPVWKAEGDSTSLSINDNFGFSPAGSAPPNTQALIAQAPSCLTAAGATMVNTACIVFNSRGIPVDATGAPTGVDAIYLTDRVTLYAITTSAPVRSGCGGACRPSRRHGSSSDLHHADSAPASRHDGGVSRSRCHAHRNARRDGHPARRHGQPDVDRFGGDDDDREPGASGRAHHRIRAGQDGTVAGAGLRGPDE
jgi:prepilin-type N-terminal cleavage/methylation domain-containing protein